MLVYQSITAPCHSDKKMRKTNMGTFRAFDKSKMTNPLEASANELSLFKTFREGPFASDPHVK